MQVLETIRSVVPSNPEPAPDPDTRVTLDEAGIAIKNERRRMAVYALAESEADQMTLGQLAEIIAASECEKKPRQLDSNERRRVYISLYQTHMSKLDSMGAVEYDKDLGTIERGPAFDSVLRILESVADECLDDSRGERA